MIPLGPGRSGYIGAPADTNYRFGRIDYSSISRVQFCSQMRSASHLAFQLSILRFIRAARVFMVKIKVYDRMRHASIGCIGGHKNPG